MARSLRRKLGDALHAYRTPPGTLTLETREGFTVLYRGHTTDEAVLKHSFSNDTYAPLLTDIPLGSGQVIVDVGAHLGGFALLAARQGAQVYAIEACRETYVVLCANVALNRLPIRPAHLALADKQGPITLWHSSGNWGHSTVGRREAVAQETVQGVTLAHYLESEQISHVDLLKLNCEGAEFPILLATDGDTFRCIDRILAEVHEDIATRHETTEITAHLTAHGYHRITITPDPYNDKRCAVYARR